MNSLPIRKALALTCALLLVPSLVLALLSTNLEKSLFDAALYKDALNVAQVYERLPALIAERLAANVGQQEGFSAMLLGALPPDALQRLLTSLLPAEAVQQLTEQGIDAAFSYLNGQTGQASLGLNQFKERLAANSGSMVDDYFSSLPDCTFEDVLALGEGLLGDGAIPVCNPPEVIREAIAVPLRSTLEQQLDQSLPDSIALQNTGGLDGLFATLRWVRTAAQLTPLLVILLLAAMTLLAVRTPWDILRWWGWPLLAAGLFALAAGLFVAPAATSLLDATFVARMAETVGAAIASLLSTVTSTFAAGLVRPIIVDALLVAAVGGVLVSVSYVTPKRQIA